MKISLISKNKETSWTISHLVYSAKKQNINLKLIDVDSPKITKELLSKLGDIVIWRSSSLNKYTQKPVFLKKLSKHKYIINQSYTTIPKLVNKNLQQNIIRKKTNVPTIITYQTKNNEQLLKLIKDNKLNYPFIAKHNYGSKGDNVYLIKNKSQLLKLKNLNKFVFQNFIKNNGDYRVFVVGGVPIGAMKRIAAKGNFLNNYSKGGSVRHIKDSKIINKLYDLSAKIAQACDLNICGVDIIQDKITNKYYFLEVNSAPQWEGFTKITKIDVSDKIIKYCKLINNRNKTNNFELIKQYYLKNINSLPNKKKLHFYTRMYLWTKNNTYKNLLKKLLPKSSSDISKLIKNILDEKNNYSTINFYQIRKKHLNNYPKILKYFEILFLYSLFIENFKKDISPIIDKYIKKIELKNIYLKLKSDKKAIAFLSTHAVNILYMIEKYLNIKNTLKVENYYKISKNFLSNKKYLNLKLYLLTHVIIGQSNFYNHPVKDKKSNFKIIKHLEEIISKFYDSISLDIKNEFLVCTKLLHYKSIISNRINQESQKSLSLIGNYIIDRYNENKKSLKQDFISSEHRNVLYIMANSKSKL